MPVQHKDHQRIVVAITGATGSVYGVRLLEVLHKTPGVEVHLVVSRWGEKTLALELGLGAADLDKYCYRRYPPEDLGAAISSGSFITRAMIIVPCSMKTLSAIAHGFAADLVVRAADVSIKERRRLVLVPRETPLSPIHLENMLTLARLGVTILPPMPAFYNAPKSVDDIVNHTVARVLDQLELQNDLTVRWDGNGQEERERW